MLLFLILNYRLTFFNSYSYYAIFHPIAELIITVGTPTKDAKAEMEMHPLTIEIEISKCSI